LPSGVLAEFTAARSGLAAFGFRVVIFRFGGGVGLRAWVAALVSDFVVAVVAGHGPDARLALVICLIALSVASFPADCLSLPVPLNVFSISVCPAFFFPKIEPRLEIALAVFNSDATPWPEEDQSRLFEARSITIPREANSNRGQSAHRSSRSG